MRKPYNQSIFIFRRDLRLQDNTGIIEALEKSDSVIPCFIFDPQQIDAKNNVYKSENCIQLMIESLQDLEDQLKKKGSRLYFFLGEPSHVLEKIFSNEAIQAVYVNHDYTPFARARDEKIKNMCTKNGVAFSSISDSVMNPIGTILTAEKKPYRMFTAFYNKAKKNSVSEPRPNKHTHYYNEKTVLPHEIQLDAIKKYYQENNNILAHGGRTQALSILKNCKKFADYNKDKNYVSRATTHLSAYNKFGCVSIREVYHALRKNLSPENDLLKQLYWRDFFYTISANFPHIYGSAFKKQYNDILWNKNNNHFELWCKGETGFPLVDACMRELNKTGFMHNRGRMIVASFLVKDLHINWQEGERYFATKLVDYDPAQNNGNWQWVASTGTDSTPYFRIFNPWIQSKKYDQDCVYIKQWIPELKDVLSQHIHTWYKNHTKYKGLVYPKPMLDHASEAKTTLKLYKKVF